jgi:hypothetical protein
MAAETNVITTEEITKVRELDYAQRFGENLKSFLEMLNITRKIPVTAGTVLKVLTVTGTLANGKVDEGDIIPLSQYETVWTPIGEVELNKWRKATTAEAILKGGYDQAVNDTDAKAILDVQKSIRTAFIGNLATGTGTASGAGLQAALANAWGQLQVKFEDEDINAVYMLNPLDVADYLAKGQISTQTAFGFTYLENFLGLGNVILTPQITKGTFYATAAENIVVNYVNVNEANGLGEVFNFTTDPETGFIGIHEDANYQRMQEETVLVAGVNMFAERPAGVIVGTITAETEGA